MCPRACAFSPQLWANADCSGTPASHEGPKDFFASDACLPVPGEDDPAAAYTKEECGESGEEISIPRFSDKACTQPADFNAYFKRKLSKGNPATKSMIDNGSIKIQYPADMKFPSGKCVQVVSGAIQMSQKVTVTDCSTTHFGMWGVGILLCCCGAPIAGFVIYKNQKKASSMPQQSMYAATVPVTGQPTMVAQPM
eukprot:COSAG05_NODE_4977_length_1304_cov_0.947718_2_plen_196_part_00